MLPDAFYFIDTSTNDDSLGKSEGTSWTAAKSRQLFKVHRWPKRSRSFIPKESFSADRRVVFVAGLEGSGTSVQQGMQPAVRPAAQSAVPAILSIRGVLQLNANMAARPARSRLQEHFAL